MSKVARYKKCIGLFLSSWLMLLSLNGLAAEADAYETQYSEFFQSYLLKEVPRKHIWLTGDKKTKSSLILGHKYSKIRVPYWYDADNNTVLWILNEIGKERPITIGIVIKNQSVVAVRILKFRESRGWEVELPAFTQQFDGIGYEDGELTRHIDGISGATLSVRAVKAVTAMALMLSEYVVK